MFFYLPSQLLHKAFRLVHGQELGNANANKGCQILKKTSNAEYLFLPGL